MTIFRVPVTIDYPAEGGPGRNVWHVRTIGPSGDDTDQLGEALDALETFYTSIRTLYTIGTDIVMGEGMIKDPLGSPEYQADDRRVVHGSGAGGSAAPLLAIVCGWRTTSATRSGRGRTFLGPFKDTVYQNDGTPDTNALDTIRTAAGVLVSASTAPAGWSIGVLSTKQGVLRDITGVSVKDRWAYLSSRRD